MPRTGSGGSSSSGGMPRGSVTCQVEEYFWNIFSAIPVWPFCEKERVGRIFLEYSVRLSCCRLREGAGRTSMFLLISLPPLASHRWGCCIAPRGMRAVRGARCLVRFLSTSTTTTTREPGTGHHYLADVLDDMCKHASMPCPKVCPIGRTLYQGLSIPKSAVDYEAARQRLRTEMVSTAGSHGGQR